MPEPEAQTVWVGFEDNAWDGCSIPIIVFRTKDAGERWKRGHEDREIVELALPSQEPK